MNDANWKRGRRKLPRPQQRVRGGTQGRVVTWMTVTSPNENLNGLPEGVKGLRQQQYAQQFPIRLYKTTTRSSEYPESLINSNQDY